MTPPEIEGLTELRELGRGGFGVVYRAHQAAFGRDVAVKVIPGGSVDSEAISRFERECRATGAVSGHPNIVRVHDAGVTADGDPYLVMDLLSNGTLADRVRRDGPLEMEDASKLGVALSGALETAHRSGIVHRDIKPENVLFSAFGDPQLVDFGIARMQDAYHSRSGSVSGTLAHAPPEVIAGDEASPRSDIYSLGSVLFFGLTGETPFGRAGEHSLLPLINRIANDSLPDLRARGISDGVASVIERAMAKASEDRFASALEMGEALRAAASADAISTPPVPLAAPSQENNYDEPVPAFESDDVTGLTKVRSVEKRPAPIPTPPPPVTGGRRRRLLIAAAGTVGVVLALLALAFFFRPDERVPLSTQAREQNTPTSTVSPTLESPTPEAPLPVADDLPVPSTARRTTAGSAPQTSAPQAATIRPPGPVIDAVGADPVTVEESNGVPQRIRITLSWRAPSDNGGSGPTRYRIVCTLMLGSSPYTGSTEPAPCKGGFEIGSTPGNVTSFQPVVERVEPGPGSWIKWEVIAVNEAGSGPSTSARAAVPKLVGLKSWVAYPYARVVGIALTGGQRSCGAEPSTVCEQSRPPGEVVAGGTNVVAYEEP